MLLDYSYSTAPSAAGAWVIQQQPFAGKRGANLVAHSEKVGPRVRSTVLVYNQDDNKSHRKLQSMVMVPNIEKVNIVPAVAFWALVGRTPPPWEPVQKS